MNYPCLRPGGDIHLWLDVPVKESLHDYYYDGILDIEVPKPHSSETFPN